MTVSQKGQYICQAEHQQSDKSARTTGCISISLQQRIEILSAMFKKEKKVNQVSVPDSELTA